MEVKTTFLNGELEEEINNQPEGFVEPGREKKFVNLLNLYMV